MAGGGETLNEPMFEDEEDDFNLTENYETSKDIQNSELYTSLMQETQGLENSQRTYLNKNGRSRTSSPNGDQSLIKRRKDENQNNIKNMNKSTNVSKNGDQAFNSANNSQRSGLQSINNRVNDINKQTNDNNLTPKQIFQAPIKYLRTDKDPFLIHWKQLKGPKNVVTVSRELQKCKVNFKLIETLSKGIWILTFDKSEEANKIVNNTFINNHGYEAFIPREKLFRNYSEKCVVRGILTDVIKEEFISSANSPHNPDLYITDCYRFQKRAITESGPTRVDTESMCFTIRGTILPKFIIIFRTNLKVTPFIPAIR